MKTSKNDIVILQFSVSRGYRNVKLGTNSLKPLKPISHSMQIPKMGSFLSRSSLKIEFERWLPFCCFYCHSCLCFLLSHFVYYFVYRI